MNSHWILFILGVLIAVFAFFNFPFPHALDKWLFVLFGIVIMFLSYIHINEGRGVDTTTLSHSSQNENNDAVS